MNCFSHAARCSRPDFKLSLSSRLRLFALRFLLRPLMAFCLRGGARRLASVQIRVAARSRKAQREFPYAYDYYSDAIRVVPGHSHGKPFGFHGQTVVLWLHGGAFVLPAMPDAHCAFVGRLCASLNASAFLPDYRLAPANPYPAGLDDCEAAYRLLLDSGVDPQRMVIGGESAGGNLLVALLYRLRRLGLPMPACAVAVSPALDLARLHGAPARAANAPGDAVLPIAPLANALDWYLAGADATHPEVSPLLGPCDGLPPMLVMASEHELLRDDSVLFADRLVAAGVTTELSLWPHLPHAFPLLEDWFPEVAEARDQIVQFVSEYVTQDVPRQGGPNE